MPLFLIPIAVGAYMYFENKRKEAEEQQQDENVTCRFKVAGASNVFDDEGCDQVIEAQLSQESSPLGVSPRIEVMFEQRVPERRESEVSNDGSDDETATRQSPPQDASEEPQKRQRLIQATKELSKFLGETAFGQHPFVLCGG